MPQHVLQDSGDWITLKVSRLCLQIGKFPLRP